MNLRSICTILIATALAACASPEDGGAATSDAFSLGPDASNESDAMSPFFNPAILTATRDVYLMPRQTTLIGITDKAECGVVRTSGWYDDRTLAAGSQFLIRAIAPARGNYATPAQRKIGIKGFLDTRARDGRAGPSAAMQLLCLGHDDGYVPTLDDIAEAFTVRGGIGLELAYSKPAAAAPSTAR